MLEEALRDALAAAGQTLSEAVRAGLVESELPSALSLVVTEGRIRVISASRGVVDAERGREGSPPTAPVEAAARAASREVVRVLHGHIEEALR